MVQNGQREARDQQPVVDTGFSQEVVEDNPTNSSYSVQVHFDWNNADFETQRAYGRALLSGHGALFVLSSLPSSY